jgi:hypothetical protein
MMFTMYKIACHADRLKRYYNICEPIQVSEELDETPGAVSPS